MWMRWVTVQERFTKGILGGISVVGRAFMKTRGSVNSLRSIHDAMKAKAAALTFTSKFFNGINATDPNEFDSLKTRLIGGQFFQKETVPFWRSFI